MKKILSMLLALTLTLSMCSTGVLAETMTTELMTLANGTTIVLEHEEGHLLYPAASMQPDYGFWMIDDGVHTSVNLRIADSEIDDTFSLGDLTEEQQLSYGEQVGKMFADPVIDIHTTPSGNRYLHISSNEASDMDTIFTIYKGCFVELTQFRHDFGPLTEQDLDFCLSILYGIEFLPAQ